MLAARARLGSTFHLLAGAGLMLAVAALVAYDHRYHEFWRDEVHPIVLGAHVPLHRLLLAKKVEGYPPLFDLLTMPLVGIVSPEWRLLLTGGLGFGVLLSGTYACLLSISSRREASLVLTALFATTYAFGYEFGVVIRPYALGCGLALFTNALLRDALRSSRSRSVVLGTVTASLCALTSSHATTYVGGSLVAFGLVSLWRQRSIKFVLPTFAVLPAFALLAYEILPFPGRSAELNVDQHLPQARFVPMALQAIEGSFTPQDWWLAATFGEPASIAPIAFFRHWAPIGIGIGVLYSVALRASSAFRSYRPVMVYDVLGLLIGWAALLEILVNHYWGSARHHQFLSLPVVVVLGGWAIQRGPEVPRILRWAPAVALPLMGAWFGYQWVMFKRDIALDMEQPFTDTKAAAAALPPDARVVAESLTMQEALMLWKPGIVMRGGDCAGRHLGYTAFDSEWHAGAPVPPMVREDCAAAPDRTFYSGWQWSLGQFASCAKTVSTASTHSEQTRPDEHMDVYKLDCACVARGK